jgi:hypothetical protein
MHTDTQAACPVKNVAGSERAVSAIGGAIIAGYAIGQRNASTPFLLFLGGLLLYRGLSGNCKLYERLGIDTNRPPRDPDEGPEGLVWNEV